MDPSAVAIATNALRGKRRRDRGPPLINACYLTGKFWPAVPIFQKRGFGHARARLSDQYRIPLADPGRAELQ
jgi:hypothetical protein